MKSKSSAFIFMILATCFSSSSDAKTTFLPDFEEEPMEFGPDCEGGGEDYCLCQRSTNPKYHLALGQPQCPRPKIFDLTCPHSNDWISECYCPASYNQTCNSPYRGVGLICDGKYEECCDTRCREGSTSSCSYPYVTDYTSSTGCGETCYVCRYGNDCNTSCSAGEEASYSGGYNDFNGQACVSCSTPPPPEPDPEPDPGPSYPDPDPEPEPTPDPGPSTPDHTHDYNCPSGYQSSSCGSGYTQTGTTSKTCSCGAKSGTCYKCEAHTHSYSCPSGYQESSCGSSYNQTGTTSKTCSCGAKSGTCYKCERKTCNDSCAQWRGQPGCQLSPWQSSRTCNDLGTGEGCTDMYCNYLWYCCK